MKYYLWHNGEFKETDDWQEVCSCTGAFVISHDSHPALVYGRILPFGQWLLANLADMPKELRACMLLKGAS